MIGAELDRLIRQAKNYLDAIDPEMEPKVVTVANRYLCVLMSANIDKCIHLIFTEFARRRGSKELHRFVSKKYDRGTNYQSEKIFQALNQFDDQWGSHFMSKIQENGLKEKLDSLYGLRNSISHGEQVTISRPTLDGYFEAHSKIIRLIASIVLA